MRLTVLFISFIVTLAGCASGGKSVSKANASLSGPMGEPVRDISAYGFVTQVSLLDRVIVIKHAPIPEMNWPPMLMSFNVVDSVDLEHFKRGNKVQFTLEVDKEDDYRIKNISTKAN